MNFHQSDNDLSDSKWFDSEFLHNVYTSTYFTPVVMYLIMQALFGIIAVEWAWKRTSRIREAHYSQNSNLDERLRELQRLDAGKWARWKLYPGAILFMIPRGILLVLNAFLLILEFKIFMIGYDIKKQGLPIKRGCRQKLINAFGRLHSKIMLFLIGMYSYEVKRDDVDYSYYLGPDYKQRMSKSVPSTLVANHISFLDPIIFSSRLVPSFAPMESLSRTPVVSTLCNALGSLYIPRGVSQELRDRTLELIGERQ